MENIDTTWFLKSPIDAEHKQYILLNFLQGVNKEIRKENIYQPIRKVFTLIKDLKLMDKIMGDQIFTSHNLEAKEKEIAQEFEALKLTPSERDELASIIEISLDSLYRYAEVITSIWKKLENRISVYNLNPEVKNSDCGILLVRNMATDEIHPYWWSRYSNSASFGILMKKVKMSNNFFSINYDHLINEIIVFLGVQSHSLSITAMEIHEDFDSDSNILKIAKELFVRDTERKLELL
jgi:hypothetical protein